MHLFRPGFMLPASLDAPRDVIEAARGEFAPKSPLQRFGEAEEIARIALFLASEDSSYMVGTEIVAGGGLSLVLYS